jgi:hypothetical protein
MNKAEPVVILNALHERYSTLLLGESGYYSRFALKACVTSVLLHGEQREPVSGLSGIAVMLW